MTTKIVEITNCHQCPSQTGGMCFHGSFTTMKVIPIGKLPDWCPLPDKVEVSKEDKQIAESMKAYWVESQSGMEAQ